MKVRSKIKVYVKLLILEEDNVTSNYFSSTEDSHRSSLFIEQVRGPPTPVATILANLNLMSEMAGPTCIAK